MQTEAIHNLILLAAVIARQNTKLMPIEISKALVKVQKLALSLDKRYRDQDYESKIVSDFEKKAKDLMGALEIDLIFDRTDECICYFVFDGKDYPIW